MQAAIDDAVSRGATLDPRGAVPVHRPRDTWACVATAFALALLGALEVRRHVPPQIAPMIEAVDVSPDDLDAVRDFLRDMEDRLQTEDAKNAMREFNQLVEDLAAQRLDRTEAFRKLQALENRLLEGRPADSKALEDALRAMGDELKKSDLTKPTGEALEQKSFAASEKALRDLAKRLRDKSNVPDKAQLDRMRQALSRAAEDAQKRQEALDKRRDELKESLLKEKQKRDGGAPRDEEQSLLKKKERELERLERESAEAAEARRELERLDRELAQAAEDLMKDLGLSAEDLERGAEDINRMGEQEMSREEKEQLRQKLEELRETMRREGQGGGQQRVRLRKFQQAARGGSGKRGQSGQSGQGGDKDQGQDGEGQQGEGQEGESGQAGQGGDKGQGGQRNGQGGGKNGGETWIVGPGGEKILVLSSSRKSGGGGQQPGGGGQGEGKQGYGSSHEGNVQGGATDMKGTTEDTMVAGQDTGQGVKRSEVIEGAAERGFTGRGYEKVYREYHTVAEEALHKDDIPGGYRFYVRRYFQLIRPRDAEDEAPPGGGATHPDGQTKGQP
jgi:hypothetical protein